MGCYSYHWEQLQLLSVLHSPSAKGFPNAVQHCTHSTNGAKTSSPPDYKESWLSPLLKFPLHLYTHIFLVALLLQARTSQSQSKAQTNKQDLAAIWIQTYLTKKPLRFQEKGWCGFFFFRVSLCLHQHGT